MYLRIGDVMVKQGILTEPDRDAILERQHETALPFGLLAEQMFGVTRDGVELAWAEQYAGVAESVDPRTERVEPAVLRTITTRQAWQFGLLPMRYEGTQLVIVTTEHNLPRALRFTGWRFSHPCYLVIAEATALSEALDLHYPMRGMSARFLSVNS